MKSHQGTVYYAKQNIVETGIYSPFTLREITFYTTNQDKWQRYERVLDQPEKHHPDKLAELYIELTEDLAYAQSQYPGSDTEHYLNRLTTRVHDRIYRSKKESVSRLIYFWTEELPIVYGRYQREMALALSVFLLAIGMGVLSQVYEPDFLRVILGDAYVNMTITNIEEGDPLAVYKQERKMDMFLGITINNIRVSFNAFVLGLATAFGSAYILLVNGIMVGAFFQFLAGFDLFGDALRVVLIHGALELSVIVIAGGAGIALGNSFIFPGTYTRLESFKRAAKDGVKMVIGLIPIFVLAGFLESFVTRHTSMPLILSIAIIAGSFAWVLYYYVYLAQLKGNNKP
ncbi:MAG: stage II sporulation protein M [Balneolaceae bacterium]